MSSLDSSAVMLIIPLMEKLVKHKMTSVVLIAHSNKMINQIVINIFIKSCLSKTIQNIALTSMNAT